MLDCEGFVVVCVQCRELTDKTVDGMCDICVEEYLARVAADNCKRSNARQATQRRS